MKSLYEFGILKLLILLFLFWWHNKVEGHQSTLDKDNTQKYKTEEKGDCCGLI